MGKFTNSLDGLFKELSENISSSELIASRLMVSISTALTKYRIVNKMDQKKFAELLDVSQPMISKYESGDYNFTIKSLSDIADKTNMELNISMDSDDIADRFTVSDAPAHFAKEDGVSVDQYINDAIAYYNRLHNLSDKGRILPMYKKKKEM